MLIPRNAALKIGKMPNLEVALLPEAGEGLTAEKVLIL